MSPSSRVVKAMILIAALVPGTAAATDEARAGHFSVLHDFHRRTGWAPNSTLIEDSAGNLYGTLFYGGNGGAVYEFNPGTLAFKILHEFGRKYGDGRDPEAGLVEDSAQNFYGTTVFGGASNDGTVFEIAANGKEKVLYSFSGGTDGAVPWGGVIRDSAGNLYGTTRSGGGGNCAGYGTGCGTVFKLAPNGQETVLYRFTGVNGDGANPAAGLIMDNAGNFYGTTEFGGVNNCANGCGTVFEIDATGSETALYAFKGGNDGANPLAGLTADGAGNMYGTTYAGGSSDNCGEQVTGCGTVYELAANGTENVLHAFTNNDEEGNYPIAGVVIDADGNLDGVTSWTIYRLAPNGHEAVLHYFGRSGAYLYPVGGLLLDSSGALYGTTSGGNRYRAIGGVIFEYTE